MRRALAGLWAILSLGALLVALAVLPPLERVPTHWSGATPDGFATGPGFTSLILTTTVLCIIAAAATSVLQRVVPPLWGRWLLTVVAGIAWGAVALFVLISWRVQVDGPTGVHQGWALLALLAAVAAALIAYGAHGRHLPGRQELLDLVPERSRVQAVRGRNVRAVQSWSTALTSSTLRIIGGVLIATFAVVLVLLYLTGEPWALLIVVLLAGLLPGVIALAWSRIEVRVDEDGLTVRSAVLPLRVARVPALDVIGVDVQELDAMRWGGIGLRALPDRTAYIVNRGGPGIVVYTRDGRRFALQITDGDREARHGARTLLQAAGQRLGEASEPGSRSGDTAS